MAGDELARWRWRFWLAVSALGVGVALIFRNTGLYASVFADERTYSLSSRLAPISEALHPSYLYFRVFALTSACGEGFLECARVLNVVFFVGAMPLVYTVCRQVTSRRASLFVALLSTLAPYSIFTAYFMPESMYYFGFWLLTSWVMYARAKDERVQGLIAGTIIALSSMVKMHGLFLIPGLGLYWLWTELTRDEPGRWRRLFKLGLSAAAGFVTVRFGVGALLAGRAGLHLLGPYYGSVANSLSDQRTFVSTVIQTKGLLIGHLSGLALMFGVPLALTLGRRRTPSPGAPEHEPLPLLHAIERYALSCLAPLLAIVVTFSVSAVGTGPYETILRLHMRYYGFLFPLLLIIAAGHFSMHPTLASARASWTHRVGFALAAGASLYAVATRLDVFDLGLADCPELTGLARHPALFLSLGALSTAALFIAVVRPVWGVTLYAVLVAPALVIGSSIVASFELRLALTPSEYDRAGQYTRHHLGDERGHVLVVGSQVAGLYRTAFSIDSAQVRLLELAENAPVPLDQIEPSRYVLSLGNHPVEGEVELRQPEFSLTRVR